MTNLLAHYFKSERNRILKECKQCGLCISKCSIVRTTVLKDVNFREVQGKILKFLALGTPDITVYTRAFSCMECFGCIGNHCPQGLNPMLVNEIIKWDYRRNNLTELTNTICRNENSLQRIIASIQISNDEYNRIFTPSSKEKVDYIFYPGCNVYLQPDKLLSAIDIMDIINENWALVPGVDYCCGDEYIFGGLIDEANHAAQSLISKLSSYKPKTVIFWCPTCLCRFGKSFNSTYKLPFKMISFPQFIAQNMDKLPFRREVHRKTVTLHEACKSAFSELDLNGTRDVLKGLPNTDLIEMPRHGKSTSCCGSGAIALFPESFDIVRNERMKEASETNADYLVDVCHFCHKIFATKEREYDYSVVNYVSLVAEALGIKREDKLKKYIHMNDIGKILDDAKEGIERSPFPRDKIVDSLNALINTF